MKKKRTQTEKNNIINAILLGGICSVSYFVVYFGRNILSAVTPQMLEIETFTTEYIGVISSAFFICYAIGQLINGIIGDKIKAKYMMSFGLILAGCCNFAFPSATASHQWAYAVYGLMGLFLSMFYAPMTKLVAENTEPVYTVRCSLGYEFGALLGAPIAGLVSAKLLWRDVFQVGGFTLLSMGIFCLIIFSAMEQKRIIRYNQYQLPKERAKNQGGIRLLIEHRIIKFTVIAIITGVVRTTVVFWLPAYIAQYLGFSSEGAVKIYTVATLVISLTAFIAVFIYEKLHRNMDLTILLAFVSASVMFLLVFFVKIPEMNIVFLILAIMSSNSAAAMLWSRYCPSLRDTGMVSSATGFLDFVSYGAASISSTIFANAVTTIGWEKLILVWLGLMIIGILISFPKTCKFSI